MALIGNIIKENKDQINLRSGEVVCDIIIEKDYLQLRTYAMGDIERERGSKQNIQLSKEKAKEIITILEQFINS
ncbi:hypothetical protein QRD02_08630 [Aequorivita sp. SDUM287046]|uniref:Uncharacterized protein n=1 Tax=Aequorivita aurantiaca TaxID=3053356 RepID=A0ABT8DN04_9FLAO|nr:hypothetical protein [Aequorivita aurantiaca]MDN3724447.1 hypothetical protein [Aequorivita aurantiaca]